MSSLEVDWLSIVLLSVWRLHHCSGGLLSQGPSLFCLFGVYDLSKAYMQLHIDTCTQQIRNTSMGPGSILIQLPQNIKWNIDLWSSLDNFFWGGGGGGVKVWKIITTCWWFLVKHRFTENPGRNIEWLLTGLLIWLHFLTKSQATGHRTYVGFDS